MTEHLHTITIGGTELAPTITFVCHGDRKALCHWYPDCDCESWYLGDSGCPDGHEFVEHAQCWMQAWFDQAANPELVAGIEPQACTLADEGYTVGMSGPVVTDFDEVYGKVTWRFAEAVQR